VDVGEAAMKALVYLGPRHMELQEVPEPQAGPGEVVIRTVASSVCGSDLHGFREASPRRIPPLIMGHETVGDVSDVGEGVDRGLVGRRVVLSPILSCGHCEACLAGRTNVCSDGRLIGRDVTGGFAERFAVPASSAVELATDVADDDGTLVEPLANAVHVTSRAVREGDDVLVIGAGPIGTLMTRMSVERGARSVLVTDRIATRLELARRQGGTPVPVEDAEASVADATHDRGVDVAIDAVGMEPTWALALRAVRPAGRIEAVGLGAAAGTLDYVGVIGKEATITGSFAWTAEDFARAIDFVQGGALDTAGWFSRATFAEGQRAFEELVDTTERFKVVLSP
jgi:2-desacetyl-2-hydroxyethyl bacteriochlorophyllide A dehydrogenase